MLVFNGNCNKYYFVSIKSLKNIFRMNSFSTLFSVVFAYLTVSTALHVSTTAASIISNPTVLQGKDVPIVIHCLILHLYIIIRVSKMCYMISLGWFISEPGSYSDDYRQPIKTKVLVLDLFVTFNKIIPKSCR